MAGQKKLPPGFEARKKSYDGLVAKARNGESLKPAELTAMDRFEKELDKYGLDLPEAFRSVTEVERYSGYKSRTIYNAIESGELIRQSDNSFLRSDVDTWLDDKGKAPAYLTDNDLVDEDDLEDPATDEQEKSAAKWDKEYRRWRAEEKKLQVEILRADYLPRAQVEREFVNRAHEYATGLTLLQRAIAHKIAQEAGVETRLVEEIFEAEARRLLTNISRKVRIDAG